jgi:GH24 family phage-related lysozyme (muramidase)
MFSEKALKLILDEEGLDQPSLWPGKSSGITIGVGYDLGYESNFENDWKPYLSPDEIARLKTVLGLKGQDAAKRAPEFKDIKISREEANRVFMDKTLPEYTRQTRVAFPGFDSLPLDAQGALVSLVYNRGAGMSGDTRLEMRNIRDLVPNMDLKGIVDQIRSMKRLWPNDSALKNRRDHEADLVESCILTSMVEPGLEEAKEIPQPQGLAGLVGALIKIIRSVLKI